ncbi:MAG: rod shape-determining protein MreC [Candidatus Omnitrophota bacterium]
MRLRWLKNLNPAVKSIIVFTLVVILFVFYIPLAEFIGPPLLSFFAPFFQLAADVSVSARTMLQFHNLTAGNQQLTNEIANLNAQLVHMQEILRENDRLRSLWSLPDRSDFSLQVALVIAADSSNWTDTITIDKGTNNAIKKGAACILENALVGMIIEAHSSSSKVALLTDINAKVPAMIQRTREEGLVSGGVEGRRGICKMKYLRDVEVGDKVISSSLGGMYPKGLLIGEVTAVVDEKSDTQFKTVEVRPTVELHALEEVMVIIGP